MQIQGQITSISFAMQDYWQDCIIVSQDVYLVYGGFRARQSVSAEVLVDMDTRFSILCHKDDGIWKIVHIHHSIPFSDQAEEEFYQKKMSEQAKNAIEKANLYRKKSEIDFMTGLYNNATFNLHVEEHLKTCKNGNSSSFSVGIASISELGSSYNMLIHNADRALCTAKRAGGQTHHWH